MGADAGKGRLHHRGHDSIIEADNTHILRNLLLQPAQGMDDTDGAFLIDCYHCGGNGLRVPGAHPHEEFLLHSQLVTHRDFDDQFPTVQTGFPHIMLKIPAPGLLYNAPVLIAQALGSQKADAGMSQRTQVIQRLMDAQFEIQHDGIIQKLVGGGIQKGNISAQVLQGRNLLIGKITDSNDAVNPGGGQGMVAIRILPQGDGLQLLLKAGLFDEIF